MENKELQRDFFLGDQWIYFKIYTGYKTSDDILVNIIGPLAEQLLQNATSPQGILTVIQSLHPHLNKLVEQKLIWKIQTDTYKREIERYGSTTMVLSEDIFYHDSQMIVKFLHFEGGNEAEDTRWLFSLFAIDTLLDTFGYTDEGKNELMLSLSDSFKREFNSNKHLVKQVSAKYRNKYKKIEEFMNVDANENTGILNLIKEKNNEVAKIAVQIKQIDDAGNMKLHINNFMTSHIHMLMNRLFTSQNRLYEMICYDFLSRYYKSKLAKKKFQTSQG